MPTAFISGIGGQDGAYLAHFLLAKKYRVVGGARSLSDSIEYSNLEALKIRQRVELRPFDLTDAASMRRALESSAPDEIYNLAAQSSVAASWKNPLETAEVTALGALRLFQSAREFCPRARIFQASSSEMFGCANGIVDETTPFCPTNPYGAAKTHAHHVAVALRESGAAISCGVLFNHESPLRSADFVSRKVSLAVARIQAGLQDELSLGNLDVVRDWGFAGDFVRAMWQMLQIEPADFLIATGKPRSLRDFVDQAFRVVGLDWQSFVRVDETLFRPSETPPIVADTTQSSTRLGWKPELSFKQLVRLMVEADIVRVAEKPDIAYFAN